MEIPRPHYKMSYSESLKKFLSISRVRRPGFTSEINGLFYSTDLSLKCSEVHFSHLHIVGQFGWTKTGYPLFHWWLATIGHPVPQILCSLHKFLPMEPYFCCLGYLLYFQLFVSIFFCKVTEGYRNFLDKTPKPWSLILRQENIKIVFEYFQTPLCYAEVYVNIGLDWRQSCWTHGLGWGQMIHWVLVPQCGITTAIW